MTLAPLWLPLLAERWQESEQKLTHVQHQKVSRLPECHTAYKNAVNLGCSKAEKFSSRRSSAFWTEKGIRMPEARWHAWVSGIRMSFLLLFDQSGSAKVQFQHPRGLSLFSAGRGQEDFWRRHLSSTACAFVGFTGRCIFPFSPWTGPLLCWLACEEVVVSGTWSGNDRVVPKSWFSTPISLGMTTLCGL